MKPLKVSEVNSYIKRIFAGDMILSNIEIEGEVSNYKKHYSGHLYFSLKDDKGRIKCVMFKGDSLSSNIELREGQKIRAKGYISIYEKSGDYQFYVKDIKDEGVGALYKKYEDLKLKLEKEGLFKEKYKKTIPFMPKSIGIVTSATGAVVKDIITVIKRRFPSCNMIIYPSLVQGADAPKNLIEGISYLDSRSDIDLIVLARGGGSIDELFAFNDEDLARAIFIATTPIISAVGHETDFTISDFVSDLRAPTPSAAAELAVPNLMHLKSTLKANYGRLVKDFEKWITLNNRDLEFFYKSINYNSPFYKIKDKRQELDMIFRDLVTSLDKSINNKSRFLSELDKKIQLINPSSSLNKGHGILVDNDGYLIKSAMDLSVDDEFRILMKDGNVHAMVKEIKTGGDLKDESRS